MLGVDLMDFERVSLKATNVVKVSIRISGAGTVNIKHKAVSLVLFLLLSFDSAGQSFPSLKPFRYTAHTLAV